MRIQRLAIKNFRLLADVDLCIEELTTVVVGRNNSGKTSLAEVVRRFLSSTAPRFRIEDFSSKCYDRFRAALKALRSGVVEREKVMRLVPYIELRIVIKYGQEELAPIGDFIVELDSECDEAVVVARYELPEAALDQLFLDQQVPPRGKSYKTLFKVWGERIPKLFKNRLWAEDPNDLTNRKSLTQDLVGSLIATNYVNAQRGLDDNTTRDTDILGKILENLFMTAASASADDPDRLTAEALIETVKAIQQTIDADFSTKLDNLLPTLRKFGYPGIGGSDIETETQLDAQRLLSNHTRVRYSGYLGVNLPESYNGLGARNLLFILLRLAGFFREFLTQPTRPIAHIIFIEEPEAHLHPQMQEVFIQQLSQLRRRLNAYYGQDEHWPVQFVVSTHSSHIANATHFETIRYFLSVGPADGSNIRRVRVKDLREGLRTTSKAHRDFLHKYLTLTRCDLFFADKAVLVEGTSERLLLPVIIQKLETLEPNSPALSSQYLSVMEVGGAYAHVFFALLDFLELRSLVITDIDVVKGKTGVKCPVHKGTRTCNQSLRGWFNGSSLSELLRATDEVKVRGHRRIAFQIPEQDGGPCGRTLEDAFVLANQDKFAISKGSVETQETEAFNLVAGITKSDFALKYAIEDLDWQIPRYITDGIRWLAQLDVSPQTEETAAIAQQC